MSATVTIPSPLRSSGQAHDTNSHDPSSRVAVASKLHAVESVHPAQLVYSHDPSSKVDVES